MLFLDNTILAVIKFRAFVTSEFTSYDWSNSTSVTAWLLQFYYVFELGDFYFLDFRYFVFRKILIDLFFEDLPCDVSKFLLYYSSYNLTRNFFFLPLRLDNFISDLCLDDGALVGSLIILILKLRSLVSVLGFTNFYFWIFLGIYHWRIDFRWCNLCMRLCHIHEMWSHVNFWNFNNFASDYWLRIDEEEKSLLFIWAHQNELHCF